jgi:hypothetical protein
MEETVINDRPFVNYFAMDLGHDRGVVAIEIFNGMELVDVELMATDRGKLADCQQKAIDGNAAAVQRGDHVSCCKSNLTKRNAA